MEKEELLSKVQADFKQMIEEVYNKGFQDGVESTKPITETIDEKNVRWVDLGLPSGNLWAYIDRGVYPNKDYYMPNLDDYRELLKGTLTSCTNAISVKGLNGKSISLVVIGYYRGATLYNGNYKLWLKSSLDENFKRDILIIKFQESQNILEVVENSDKSFTGDTGSILYCKHPEK